MGKQYHVSAGRVPEQIDQMARLEAEGICAFCESNLPTEHQNPIEFASECWIVTKNDYPYQDTRLHLLLIAKEHVRTLGALSVDALCDLGTVLAEVEKRWQLGSYAVGIRSGDIRYNGASVEHLHAHVVVGDTDNPDHEVVRFKMSSQPPADTA